MVDKTLINELANKEYLRAVRKISQGAQESIFYSLKSFECLINPTIYEEVLQCVRELLEQQEFSVIRIGMLLYIMRRYEPVVERTGFAPRSTGDGVEQIQVQFDEFIDRLPISRNGCGV